MDNKKRARVLIVEDDEDDYIIARDSLDELDEYQFTIDWVTNHEQALAKLAENNHDICLLDYLLGACTGLNVLTRARELQCRVPIIMLTGQADKVLDKAAMDAGAVDFVLKSEFDSPRFSRAILYALARHEVEKERLERIDLQTKSRAKDRFLAHLSHELRTPLTSILGYAEILLENEDVSQAHQELNIILTNGNHLLSLLNDVLDLSKIAANKLELSPAIVHLDSFLADIHTLVAITALDKGIELVFEAKSELPCQVVTDATRLRQVLINLIHNAIKFTDQGSVKVFVSSTATSSDTCEIQFEVCDTGAGIPKDKIDSIFQPFEQVGDILAKEKGGAGLGLAISSDLAVMLGGEITVTSALGAGSQFCLTLNLTTPKDVAYDQPQFRQTKYAGDNRLLGKLVGKILVVDDLFDIRRLVGHLVSGMGLDVAFASNGQEAINLVKDAQASSDQYDAIIMDIHMPIMDGKEAVQKIRNLGYSNKIMALTAATMKGVEDHLISLGFSAVLSKPVDKHLLYNQLAESLKSQSSAIETPNLQHTDAAETKSQQILLVEDDHDAADITRMLLESLGASVTVVHSAKGCMQEVGKNQYFHKVLLDLHLPDAHGFELAPQLSAMENVEQIIVVSGELVEQQQLDTYLCDKSLLKPLNKDKLSLLLAE